MVNPITERRDRYFPLKYFSCDLSYWSSASGSLQPSEGPLLETSCLIGNSFIRGIMTPNIFLDCCGHLKGRGKKEESGELIRKEWLPSVS